MGLYTLKTLHTCICFWNLRRKRQRRRRIHNYKLDEEVLPNEIRVKERRKRQKLRQKERKVRPVRKLATVLLLVEKLQIQEKRKRQSFRGMTAARAARQSLSRTAIKMNPQMTVLKVTQTSTTSSMEVPRQVELDLMERLLDTKRGAGAPRCSRGTLVGSQGHNVANECWQRVMQLQQHVWPRRWQLGMEVFIQAASCSRWE